MSSPESAFPYHEPPIRTILNQTGLLLSLNLINTCLDKLLYCGLIGQLFIGILWGTPGAAWLSRSTETVIQQLGYLGLIMLVYEGGLSTSLSALKANMYLSLVVAFTGIGVPMALSFIPMELVGASPLQAFAAGAALSATSLGTTFTILSTTGLITTRLGVVTTSAAMLDDVVGLVMVQIISNLGGSGQGFSAVTVVRPLFVSIGFGVGVVLACRFVLRPVVVRVLGQKGKFPEFVRSVQFAFLAHTVLLVGMVAGATYAGTSSLFAAYLAGVIASWFDGLNASSTGAAGGEQPQANSQTTADHKSVTALRVYEQYYAGPVKRILTPMFFASIGFAIPITEMFQGSVVWRGFVYAILMTFGKMCTGLWLVRISPASGLSTFVRALTAPFRYAKSCLRSSKPKSKTEKSQRRARRESTQEQTQARPEHEPKPEPGPAADDDDETRATSANVQSRQEPQQQTDQQLSTSPSPPNPKSLYPASILSLAMVARGEIGYLIASLAESNQIFEETASGRSSETYLIVVWAISLCTLVGPISVGSLVRRVKSLQQQRRENARTGTGTAGVAAGDPLGVWGV